MQPDEIQQKIQAALEGAEVRVAIDGSHVNLVVISDVFEGLTPLKRQQRVYAVLADSIASGAIHAVNMKTYTTEQWRDSGQG